MPCHNTESPLRATLCATRQYQIPDPDLAEITAVWRRLPVEIRSKILELARSISPGVQ
jgi:hypothetical protein